MIESCGASDQYTILVSYKNIKTTRKLVAICNFCEIYFTLPHYAACYLCKNGVIISHYRHYGVILIWSELVSPLGKSVILFWVYTDVDLLRSNSCSNDLDPLQRFDLKAVSEDIWASTLSDQSEDRSVTLLMNNEWAPETFLFHSELVSITKLLVILINNY